MKKTVTRKLQEIQDSVPQEWRDALMKKEYIAPDLRQEAIATLAEYKKVIDSGDTTEIKDYRRLKNLFDAGYYDATEMKVDEVVGKKIEDYVESKIKEAMQAGELPKEKSDKDLKGYLKKLRKYARTK